MGSEEFSPFAFLRFSSLFFIFHRFSLILLEDKGKTTAIYCKNGEFHSDPSVRLVLC